VDEFAKAYHDFLTPSILYCNGPEDLIQFNKHLFRRNTISVFEIENKRQNGIIHSVDENGFLLVELENQGMKKFTYKELKLMY
jgi:BirA family biotin operon repressor/biotin-[acetyl-CoA-carboxylase] ligase